MTCLLFFCEMLATYEADLENGTQVGNFVVEHPTLLNPRFEWRIHVTPIETQPLLSSIANWMPPSGDRRCRWY